jgi:gliding motility-associated lipoprotein GldH
MRSYLLLFGLLIFTSCDKARVYEKDHDFENLVWTVNETPAFEFDIKDSTQLYNIYYRIRNSNDYPYARIFVKYNLVGPSQKVMAEKLVSSFLFDQKTGVPLGSSGIGDKFDHQFPLLAKQKFSELGKYKVTFEQFMRTDTLKGLEAVGLRVEKSE